MARGAWFGAAAGVAAGAAAALLWRQYRRRPLERIPSLEGLDDRSVADAYSRIAAMPQMALLRRLAARRAVALKASGVAADIGCGPGYLVVELARRAPGLHVTGVDLAEDMLKQGRATAAHYGVWDRVSFRKGDAARLPFEDGSLDLVVSTLSLHHWSDPVAALTEVGRVLRPGGAFMIFDLRRDLAFPFWSLIWFATRVVVPAAVRGIGEPLGSRNAAYTPDEAAGLVAAARLRDWQVTAGPLWLTIETYRPETDG